MLLDIQDLYVRFRNAPPGKEAVKGISLDMREGGDPGPGGGVRQRQDGHRHGLGGAAEQRQDGTLRPDLLPGMDLLQASRGDRPGPPGQEIAVVFQEPMTSMDPVMPIGPQVEEALMVHTKLGPAQRRRRPLQAMADAELPEPAVLYGKYPHELSGGMLQRAMVAAAIISEPKLLICDEPTTALDVTIQEGILNLLKKINREKGTGILFISHNLHVVRKLCTRVAVMCKGQLLEEGPVDQVFFHPQADYTKGLIAAIPTRRKQGVRTMEPILEIRNLNSFYHQGGGAFSKKRTVQVLKNVNVTLGQGGGSGPGGGVRQRQVHPGQVHPGHDRVPGEIIHHSRRPQMIFQDPYSSLNPAFSIRRIVEEPLRIFWQVPRCGDPPPGGGRCSATWGWTRSSRPEARPALRRAAAAVSIAAAMIVRPKLVILDEAVSALDVTIQDQILDLLMKLRQEFDLSYLFISHDLNVIYQCCDRVIVMQKGRSWRRTPWTASSTTRCTPTPSSCCGPRSDGGFQGACAPAVPAILFAAFPAPGPMSAWGRFS